MTDTKDVRGGLGYCHSDCISFGVVDFWDARPEDTVPINQYPDIVLFIIEGKISRDQFSRTDVDIYLLFLAINYQVTIVINHRRFVEAS